MAVHQFKVGGPQIMIFMTILQLGLLGPWTGSLAGSWPLGWLLRSWAGSSGLRLAIGPLDCWGLSLALGLLGHWALAPLSSWALWTLGPLGLGLLCPWAHGLLGSLTLWHSGSLYKFGLIRFIIHDMYFFKKKNTCIYSDLVIYSTRRNQDLIKDLVDIPLNEVVNPLQEWSFGENLMYLDLTHLRAPFPDAI
jgi:hypothetical protein